MVSTVFAVRNKEREKVLTRRQVEHGRASVDNIRVLCGIRRLVPSYAIRHNRVEGVLPSSFRLANKICLEHLHFSVLVVKSSHITLVGLGTLTMMRSVLAYPLNCQSIGGRPPQAMTPSVEFLIRATLKTGSMVPWLMALVRNGV